MTAVAKLPENKSLTAEHFRQLVHYDKDTGKFTWRVCRGGGVKAGDEFGYPGAQGYMHANIGRRFYKLHRLAWLYVHGEFPDRSLAIDHINGDRRDNRIENLRLCKPSNNAENRMRGWGRSNLIGVDMDKRSGRWRARIKKGGRSISLGTFDTPDEAHAAYLQAKAEIHPFWVKGDCNVAQVQSA